MEEEKFLNKIKNFIPQEDDKVQMIATLLGASGGLAEFVMKNNDVSKLPLEVAYAVTLVASNMIAFISDGKAVIKDMDEGKDYKMGEQTQERIYRRMKWIIEELYRVIQEKEKI